MVVQWSWLFRAGCGWVDGTVVAAVFVGGKAALFPPTVFGWFLQSLASFLESLRLTEF